MSTPPPSLTNEEKIEVFKLATRGLIDRCGEKLQTGMSDSELRQVLEDTLGIFGGCAGPGVLSVVYQGSGLRIWGGWHIVNHCQEAPLFSGAQTIAQARETHNIPDLDDNQMRLL